MSFCGNSDLNSSDIRKALSGFWRVNLQLLKDKVLEVFENWFAAVIWGLELYDNLEIELMRNKEQ